MEFPHRVTRSLPLSIIHHQDMEILLEQLSERIDQAYDFPSEHTITVMTIAKQAVKDVLSPSAGEWRTLQQLSPIDRTPVFTDVQLHMQHPTFGPVKAILQQPGIWQLTQGGVQHPVTDRHIANIVLPALHHTKDSFAQELLDSDLRSLSTQQLVSALDSHFAATAPKTTQKRHFRVTDVSGVFSDVPHHQPEIDLSLIFRDARQFQGNWNSARTTHRHFGAAALFMLDDARVCQHTTYTWKQPIKGKPSQSAQLSLMSKQLTTTQLSPILKADICSGTHFQDLQSGIGRFTEATQQSDEQVRSSINFPKD